MLQSIQYMQILCVSHTDRFLVDNVSKLLPLNNCYKKTKKIPAFHWETYYKTELKKAQTEHCVVGVSYNVFLWSWCSINFTNASTPTKSRVFAIALKHISACIYACAINKNTVLKKEKHTSKNSNSYCILTYIPCWISDCVTNFRFTWKTTFSST